MAENQEPEKGEKQEEPNKGGDAKSFTQEQLDEIVSKRVNEANAKAEKSIATKIAEATAEADRKAKLSADEREKEDRAKRDRENSERETTLSLREARIEARDILQSKGISTDLVDFVINPDLDVTKANIDKLEKSFAKAVETGVADKLKGKAPEDFGGNGGDGGGENKKPVGGQIAF